MSRIRALLAAAALALGSSYAHADPALVTDDLNMRASPSTSFRIVDVIPGGAVIDARYCISNGWCRVAWNGNLGWVSGRHLLTERRSGWLAPPPPFFGQLPPYFGG